MKMQLNGGRTMKKIADIKNSILAANASPEERISGSIFDNIYFKIAMGFLSACLAIGLLFLIDFVPSLSHLNIRIYSGATSGNYYQVVSRADEIAKKKRGSIHNISTKGSIDNIRQLTAAGEGGRFALVQNGLPWGKGQELVAHLTSPETVFFLGAGADRVRSFSDLKSYRIGIGPRGSGTAHLAERIFSLPALKSLGVVLSYHDSDEQVRLLAERKLDLGVFVISEASGFIEKAVCERGLQIASIRQSESISQRLPFLRPGLIREGLFDPVKNLPSEDKHVLKIDTLLVHDGGARRSQVIGLLSVMNELNPGFINYNRSISNMTGLPQSSAARDYFTNEGPEILDRYAPRLMDFLPLSSLVQLVMVVSVFFNAMGVANRYRLWRIDANRLSIENDIVAFFGTGLLPGEIAAMKPRDDHKTDQAQRELKYIIGRLQTLEARCRKQSTSMLVPMGTEMAYRYQEDIISKNLISLKAYRDKFDGAR